MTHDRFWRKAYDPGLSDIDPTEFETTYPEIFKESFRDFPERTALAFMGVHITYAQLDRYANRFANMLLAMGLQKGSVVGINLPNIPEYVIAILGTLRAGCVVSGVSPLLSAEEMEYQLRDSQAKMLVTLDAIFEHRLVEIVDHLPNLKAVIATSVGGFLPGVKRFLGRRLGKIPTGKVTPLEGKNVQLFKDVIRKGNYPEVEPHIALCADDIAYIQYTGGTTGIPKGALLSHRNMVSQHLIVNRWLRIDPGKETILSAFPYFHVAGLFIITNTIYMGGTAIVIPNPRDTDHICAELKKYKPSFMNNVPSLYLLLMDNPKFKTLNHAHLHVCFSAAAPFPEQPAHNLETIVGAGKLIEAYGMTETSGIVVANQLKGQKKVGAVGLPLLNTDIRLIDPATGSEVGVGEPGEICVKGPQVMVGYYNRPEETKAVIDQDGYLHTGDVAFQDVDGYLHIVDRTKDMIIVGGFKAFSTKIEDVLSRHPSVNMAATVGIANPERPGSELVKAYVVLNAAYQNGKDVETLKQEIIGFAKGKLAPYEVPKEVEIREVLPLTAIGKVDKKVLRHEVRPGL